jgi:starch phosphorylase
MQQTVIMPAPPSEQRSRHPVVAYFSMEMGLDSAIPTYSGGLGVLAGDTLRAAADLGLPMVGVTLLYRKGHFHQHLDAQGQQTESPDHWVPETVLEPVPARAAVMIEGERVQVRAWQYTVRGLAERALPVYLLDTALPENSAWAQTITDLLYGGDTRYRLAQEIVLGAGGFAILRALGHEVRTYHMNEGHAALLTLALLEEQTQGRGLHAATAEDMDAVRRKCVFTTHTPVSVAHDQFEPDLVRQMLGDELSGFLTTPNGLPAGTLNLTYLALETSSYINGVAMRHGEVSRSMFPNYSINSITNGVHVSTWTSPPFGRLYDRLISEWRRDNLYLRHAVTIPLEEIRRAHAETKVAMLLEIERRAQVRLDPGALTIGFARRATSYKRGDLLFSDLARLRQVVKRAGPLQIVYAGKAHPRDEGGKAVIRRVFEAAAALEDVVKVVYLADYDMELARHLCSGVDLWLNTPQKPYEASGTSGMKAALNGVPSFSILDGWWVEGHVEGVTGWSIGDSHHPEADPAAEIASLYDKLERVIMPMFYDRPGAYRTVMRSAIALNGAFFTAQRMLNQYARNAYAFPVRWNGA